MDGQDQNGGVGRLAPVDLPHYLLELLNLLIQFTIRWVLSVPSLVGRGLSGVNNQRVEGRDPVVINHNYYYGSTTIIYNSFNGRIAGVQVGEGNKMFQPQIQPTNNNTTVRLSAETVSGITAVDDRYNYTTSGVSQDLNHNLLHFPTQESDPPYDALGHSQAIRPENLWPNVETMGPCSLGDTTTLLFPVQVSSDEWDQPVSL